MSSITNLPPEILLEIFEYLAPYELLDNIQDVCITWRELARRLPLWQDFVYPDSLDSFVFLDGDGKIIKFVKNCPMLKHFAGRVYEYQNPQVREEFVAAVISNCFDVRSFDVDFDDTCLSLSQMERLSEAFPNLESLTVGIGCEKHVNALVKFTKLKKLTVEKLRYSIGLFKPVVDGCAALEYLNFEGSARLVFSDLLYVLQSMKDRLLGLQFGNTNCHQNLTQPAIDMLGFFTKLENLLFYHTEMTGQVNYMPLANIRMLKNLTLTYRSQTFDDWKTLFDALFENPLPLLQELNINAEFCECNRPVLKDIFRYYPKLKTLHLRYQLVDGLKDVFTRIAKLDRLESFTYTNSKVMTDNDTEHIAKCFKLKHLNLSCNKGLTDKSVMNLTKCKYLETLKFSSCSLTANSLKLFACNFKRLRYLNIIGFEAKQEDIDAIEEKLPNLRIEYG